MLITMSIDPNHPQITVSSWSDSITAPKWQCNNLMLEEFVQEGWKGWHWIHYPSHFYSILSLCSSYILTLIPKDFSSAYSPAWDLFHPTWNTYYYVRSPKTSIFNHFRTISKIQNYRVETHLCSKWKSCASPQILLLPTAAHGEEKKRLNILYSAVLSSSCNLTPEWWLHRCTSTQSAFSAALSSPQHFAQLPTCLAAGELNGE